MTGAGKFISRVRFDVRIETPDPGGGSTFEWSTAETGSITRWAGLTYLKGTETVMGMRLTGIQPALVRVIWDSNTVQITPAWRAVLVDDGVDGTVFAIKSICDQEGQRRELTILAEAGAADA